MFAAHTVKACTNRQWHVCMQLSDTTLSCVARVSGLQTLVLGHNNITTHGLHCLSTLMLLTELHLQDANMREFAVRVWHACTCD